MVTNPLSSEVSMRVRFFFSLLVGPLDRFRVS